MTIVIAGAGLSGLCAAQGLLHSGFNVQVYERDVSAQVRRQGYRITTDKYGVAALKGCLPPHLFELFLATGGKPGGHFRFLNQNLDEAFGFAFKASGDADLEAPRQIDRGTLRALLLSGIEDRVHYSKTVERAEETADGVVIHFSDRTTAQADLLVGADGWQSNIRQQLLPDCTPEETGYVAIYGKTLLKQPGKSLMPKELLTTGMNVFGKPGRAFFFTTMSFTQSPKEAFALLAPDQLPPTNEDYIMWAMVVPKQMLPAEIWDQDAQASYQQALTSVREYHPFLQKIVQAAEVDFTIVTGLHVAVRPTNWMSSRITLMGDAVHIMPPFGAHGGNTALRDAALLTDKIRAAYNHNKAIQDVIDSYQREMMDYAFKEVDSAKSLMKQSLEPNPLMYWVIQTMLPTVNSVVKGRFSKHFSSLV
jgi:2-polyprenyl-6-methoxyphenol hydroxylase-like FAD-dependent oxidoreductase